MSIRSPDGALTSESFDPLEQFSCVPTKAVNIAKWREDISGATPSDLFFCSLDFQDMNNPDVFELKHDSASEYSMDSAYQSQTSATRRGTTMPEVYQPLAAPDTQTRVNSQFIYSPTLSSDNFNAFTEPQSDMSQMHLPSAAQDVEAGENTFPYANHTSTQDYSPYTTAVQHFPDMGFQQWGSADAQTYNAPFPFVSHPKSSHSLDTTLYLSQDPNEMMFNTQQHLSKPRIDTSVRNSVRSSSYTTQQPLRSSSTHDAGFSFVLSPTSAIPEFEQLLETRTDKEETASNSLAPQSVVDEDELLSPSDAAEAQTMEEEQGKLARSHPLYQAQPDANGKYHCPNEGKAGCAHKPTPLKCNYDKYVDSHLKPFRCNKKACVGVQFSSTACLLRHEREAHGMHGHGSRPHLCHFSDCERSVPGHGFPRRYNLFDHMKRVHDFTGPTNEPSPPAPSQAPTSRKTLSRKRKSTADDGSEKRQKVPKPTAQQQLEQRRGRLQADFLSKKQNIINILTKLSGPNDLRDDIQLTKEVVLLHDISAEFKKSIGG
ncbi:hypothetical protein K505DRAFT_323658 [Melanomma pulvis-pyrius CBS 109.77]|uniref:C2H2-type domain-containing protein n=1 Tax=Melanomma pulvis-pyrius CBS 109.77 TaxID=1314802 RepID=A0A6A6XHS4_9PLEO|nr:hypothetical protein K505DRAFT_323658 [Melanomma pulvis-pyrius CBS 109.77]